MGDRSIHRQGERLDDQGFARLEMSVKATVRETRELHQASHAHAIGAGLTQTIGGFFDNPAPGLRPVTLHIAHGRLSSILISPFFPELAKLRKEVPCRAALLVKL